MAQVEKAMGIDPATWMSDPSWRAEMLMVTSCEVPRMVSTPLAVVVIAEPDVKELFSVTG